MSWQSQLQSYATQSTIDAKYVAASYVCKEAIWFDRLLVDLGIMEEMTLLHCDSQSVIPVFHAKTKHVDVRYHFIREVLEDKRIQLVKVHTTENPADLLTKGLPRESFAHCFEILSIT